MQRRLNPVLFPLALAVCLLAPSTLSFGQEAEGESAFSAEDLEFFEREVRPILANRCYECHGPELEEAKGGLRFDSHEALLMGGDSGPAVEPGDPDLSLLIEAVRYEGFYNMPPQSKLPDEEIAVIEDWVTRGAPWPHVDESEIRQAGGFDIEARRDSHWAWHPPQETQPPAVVDESWPRDDIDRYILARLEAEGLAPSPEADRRTLIRRLYFDLIGLPPTPEEVQAFVDDPAPDAYEKVVEHLLASERFGERWGRHWLDLARYCETGGHEFDYPIEHAWHYRDYVIRAFNNDLPYNQFVIEQIAGDLVEQPRINEQEGYNESILGTGFWFFNEWKHGPVDPIKEEMDYIDNRIDVMSKTFLGMTVSCARCHDHKFDAISTQDYYALAGYLASTHRQDVLLDPHGTIANVTGQIQAVCQGADERLLAALPPATPEEGQRFAAALAAPAGQPWEAPLVTPMAGTHPLWLWQRMSQAPPENWAAELAVASEQVTATQNQYNSEEERSVLYEDFEQNGFGNWTATGHAFGDSPTRSNEWNARGGGVELATPGLAHSGRFSHREQGVLRSPTFTITHPQVLWRVAGQNCSVRVIIENYRYDVYNALLYEGCLLEIETEGNMQWLTQAGSIGHYLGFQAHLEIVDHGDGWIAVDEIRFSEGVIPQTYGNAFAQEVLAAAPDSREAFIAAYGTAWQNALTAVREGGARDDQVELVNWALAHGLVPGVNDELRGTIEQARVRREELGGQLVAPVYALGMVDALPEDLPISVRGNPHVEGDLAPRQLLSALQIPRQPLPEDSSGRMQLALEIVDPANPLTTRVMVNRVWHHLFGQGIVPTPDNFGLQGIPPSHPELLDHLALRFMREGWSTKQLIRNIVLSNTYRQASLPTAGDQADPENRLLHRQNLRRLEGEAIRDSLLAISGRLDTAMYGPSVPIHITPFMAGRGRPDHSGELDGLGRRSIYIEVRRNFLSPFMLTFDTPAPATTIGERSVSNVPAQSLILMNDPFVLQQATRWAEQLLARGDLPFEQRLDRLYQEAYGRSPTPEEQATLSGFYNQQAELYGIAPEARAADVRLWTDVCHVLINVKEFIYIN